jgi:ATP-dependent protease HslVU (ClpYQ) peptidase subunit
MTAIVGIRCRDVIVIGSDSSATFGDGIGNRFIEQSSSKKIEIIGETLVVAGTGAVGHMQRFSAVVQRCWDKKDFMNKSDLEIGKMLSSQGILDFNQTHAMNNLQFSAMIAYPAADQPALCEFSGGQSLFQPEIKHVDDLWFASAGSGQPITDPFLALLRKAFWSDGAPTVQGGIFTALWALQHACEVNPGGIKEPIKIAKIARMKGKLRASLLDETELAEHLNMVAAATTHMSGFRDILEGNSTRRTFPCRPSHGKPNWPSLKDIGCRLRQRVLQKLLSEPTLRRETYSRRLGGRVRVEQSPLRQSRWASNGTFASQRRDCARWPQDLDELVVRALCKPRDRMDHSRMVRRRTAAPRYRPGYFDLRGKIASESERARTTPRARLRGRRELSFGDA